MARPRRYSREVCVPTTINLPKSLRIWFEERAKSCGVSRSVAMTEALERYASCQGFHPEPEPNSAQRGE
jgi:hypothetical protein